MLEELARTPVEFGGTRHRMLVEVDIISSVSGGSFTAAYYAHWGDRVFSEFESQFLKKDVQSGLLRSALSPRNQLRLEEYLPQTSRHQAATGQSRGRRLSQSAVGKGTVTCGRLHCGVAGSGIPW